MRWSVLPRLGTATRVWWAAAVALVILAFSGVGANATPVANSNGTPPPARCCAGMAYDATHQNVVLYGGATLVGNLGDTWTWDGTAWTQLTPEISPGLIYNSAMVDDAAAGTVLLFGGQGDDSQALNGTWSWNGTTWTQLHPITAPSPRASANLAYDAATQTVVLFGGCCTSNGQPLNDAWTWNGTTWTQNFPSTSPPGSASASMAYDATHQQIVLFGGCCNAGFTWTWDGSNWTKVVTSTAPTLGGQLVDDPTTQSLVLFQSDGTTWTWDGTSWSEQSPSAAPAARNQGGLVDDAAIPSVLLFGGSVGGLPQNDAWTWDGTTWTQLGPPTPGTPSPE